jgi:hypothetical protein
MNRFRVVALVLFLPAAAYGQSQASGLPDPNACPVGGCIFTGPVQMSADPTTALAPATKQYVDARSGGSGTTMPTPVLHKIPAVSSVTAPGQFVASAFLDDTNNTFDSEPFFMVGETQQAQGTATATQNFISNFSNWNINYWNGTIPVTASWSVYGWVAQGASPPATVLTYASPTGLPVTAVLFATDPNLLATASINYATPKLKLRGSCWNGTASVLDDWNLQGTPGTGANPTETFLFQHVGCSGSALIELPGLKVDGITQIATGVSTNTDITGELSFSAATTATYTWANTYVSHPECHGIEPQFNTTAEHWVTYTGVTSFTINFSAAVTGAVSYGCTGRN